MGNEMMRATVTIEGVEGKLTYYMLVDIIELEGSYLPTYGVSATLELADRLECCKIHNVTASRKSMQSFMEKIAAGTVLPITLQDVIEDFIA